MAFYNHKHVGGCFYALANTSSFDDGFINGLYSLFSTKWPNLQIALESLFGGLATGLGLQFLVAFGSKNHVAAMIIAPLLLWLILRILFMGLETKYTLSPNAAVAQMRVEDAAGKIGRASCRERVLVAV